MNWGKLVGKLGAEFSERVAEKAADKLANRASHPCDVDRFIAAVIAREQADAATGGNPSNAWERAFGAEVDRHRQAHG